MEREAQSLGLTPSEQVRLAAFFYERPQRFCLCRETLLKRVGATLGATIGVTTGAGKLFTNLLIIRFGVRGVTKKPPQASGDWITQALREKPTQAFALLNCSRSQRRKGQKRTCTILPFALILLPSVKNKKQSKSLVNSDYYTYLCTPNKNNHGSKTSQSKAYRNR